MMKVVVFVAIMIIVVVSIAVVLNIISRDEIPRDKLCGPYSLFLICKHFGVDASLRERVNLSGTDASGTTMLGLLNAAQQKGLFPKALKLEFGELHEYLPCITFFEPYHFVVVRQILGESISVEDQTGPYQVTRDSFLKKWNGVILVFPKLSKGIARLSEEAPNLVFDETSHDLGEVLIGQIVSHEFKLTNSGSANLIISELGKSCGCLSVSLLRKGPIRPMEHNIVIVKIKKDSVGKFKESIKVCSNDPAKPEIVLLLEGMVVQPIIAQPPRLDFGSLSQNEVVERQVTVVEMDQGNLQVETFHVTSSCLSAQLQKLEPSKVSVIITTNPPLPVGILSEKLRLTFKHKQQTILDVPIVGEVTGTFAASPHMVFFGTIPAGTLKAYTISISSRDSSVRLTDVKHQSKGIQVELKAEEGWAKYQLHVSLTPEAPTGMLQDLISIYNEGQNIALTVPVYAYIKK